MSPSEPVTGVLRLLNDFSDSSGISSEMKIRIWEARHSLIRFADTLRPGDKRFYVEYLKMLLGSDAPEDSSINVGDLKS